GRFGDLHCGQTFTRGVSIACVARRLSRRDLDVFLFGTAMSGRHCSRRRLQLLAKGLQDSPARVGLLLVVLVGLLVEILAALGAEARAVGAAEDLVGKGERD